MAVKALKLDFSDFKQVCDIIVNNLFMRGITQIGIANHRLYSIAFARAELIHRLYMESITINCEDELFI